MEKSFRCSICGSVFQGKPNNARPYKDGICCDACNYKVVRPIRINLVLKGGKL